MLRDAKPGHPFLDEDDLGLLAKLKGWRRDRQSGEEGLTLAGALMFGTWDAIQDAAPHYLVDYREYLANNEEVRWVDRVVPDGSWSGNLFDFYRIVYSKLTNPEALKVPFRLKQGQRQDDTPVHEAIREALVNTLVHADYTGTVSVLVEKYPDMIGFRNPGNMRIPRERAIEGGDSDCRNRAMHQMFLMIGLGERGGSGIPKIYAGWRSQHWRAPSLSELDEPPQTLLALRMLELMPADIVGQLRILFGERFQQLSELERLILSVAATESVVTHKRITEISVAHARDITLCLSDLVRKQFLTINGHGRGAVYHLVGHRLPTPEQVFGISGLLDNSSVDKSTSSVDSDISSVDSQLDEQGRLLTGLLPAPVIHDLSQVSSQLLRHLQEQSRTPREKQRVNPELMQSVLLALCDGHFVTRACLAELVNRDVDSLRTQYLTALVAKGELQLAFPQNPTHPRQAYIKNTNPLAANEENFFDE